jgi:hypothetical protein
MRHEYTGLEDGHVDGLTLFSQYPRVLRTYRADPQLLLIMLIIGLPWV